MKLLIVADPAVSGRLANALAADFEIVQVADTASALALSERQPFDAVLLHFDLGEGPALDLICVLKRRVPEHLPGVVVLAREIERRAIVELVRTGAYDVLVEAALHSRELAHALRNAATCARSAALLDRRRWVRSKEVLVVGDGAGAESIARLLEAAGFSVRRANHLPPEDASVGPRAIVVDLATGKKGQPFTGER